MTKPRTKYYTVQAYQESSPGYFAYAIVASRREATTVFGMFRSKYPEATVTLNRRQAFVQLNSDHTGVETIWLTTRHHHLPKG